MPEESSAAIERLHKKARALTSEPGVYLMHNRAGEIIYVGKAKKLKNRVSSYFRSLERHTPKVLAMVMQVEDFETIVTSSEFEALVLECSLIKLHNPKYNILLKDDQGLQLSADQPQRPLPPDHRGQAEGRRRSRVYRALYVGVGGQKYH